LDFAVKGLITDGRVTAAVTTGKERALTNRGITEAVTVVVKRVSTVGHVVVTSTIIQGEVSGRRIQISVAVAIKRLRAVGGVLVASCVVKKGLKPGRRVPRSRSDLPDKAKRSGASSISRKIPKINKPPGG
jgi:hypothetical protein